MMRLGSVLLTTMLVGACGNPPAATSAIHAGDSRTAAVRDLAQMMRGIPFPASNIIFDTQTEDPGVEKKPNEGTKGATATFASVYGGWQLVENNALAIAETANLLMIPGRMCENGRPVPLDREDFRKFAPGWPTPGRPHTKPHSRRIWMRWWKSAARCLTRARPVTRSIATRTTSRIAVFREAGIGSGAAKHVRRMLEALPLIVADLRFENFAHAPAADNSRQR